LRLTLKLIRPKRKIMHYRSGNKEIYVPNDEAIEQVLSILNSWT